MGSLPREEWRSDTVMGSEWFRMLQPSEEPSHREINANAIRLSSGAQELPGTYLKWSEELKLIIDTSDSIC